MNDNFRPIGMTARQISERLRLKRAEMLEQAADEYEALARENRIKAQMLRHGVVK